MIKNPNTALALSFVIAMVFGVLAIFVLGTDSWTSVIIEFVVFGVAFIVAYNVLPYTTSELANADNLVRRIKLINEAKEDIANIRTVRGAYTKVKTVYDLVTVILDNATRTLSDVNQPGENSDSKLVMLHAYLDDFDKFFYYIYQIESGDLTVDDAQTEIQGFKKDLPELAEAFKNLKAAVNAPKAAQGKAHGAALKMKMATQGMKRTTLPEINELIK